ncbi:hypothetical protein [Thalassotalea profundi]|nr:hypothetical protein [Thalassotalea profundi]
MRVLYLLLLIQINIFINIAYAKLNYVSLNTIESELREPLFLKLNIVGSGNNLPLRFTLVSQKNETEMAAHRLNAFMVRLASIRPAIGESFIQVYEFDGQAWQKVQQVDISNKLESFDPSLANRPAQKNITSPVAPQVTSKEPDTECQLTRESKETLWSIASRYKDNWRVDVFSAMLAIFQTNKNKFSHQHIGYLIDNASLACPSRKTIAMMGEKEAMKAEFFRLNKLPI